MNRTRSKPDAGTERANAFLAPVIDGTADYGAKKRLAAAMAVETGEPVSRFTLERWLARDPKKRQQPLLGNGLLLRETFNKLKPKAKRKEKKHNGQYTGS